jgi:di/tricarboxylate transporter
MMVFSAGNYRFMEFVIFGVPFQLYMLVVAGFILAFFDEWQKVS